MPILSQTGDRRTVVWHSGSVGADQRARRLGQRPVTVWLTGLSAAGKSTLAFGLERELLARGHLACVLDGDNLRHGLNRDLGFSPADRRENIRRVAEVARLMNDAGLIVVSAFISPYREDRRSARRIIVDDRFVEVFLDAPLAVCEARDPKGLYRRARDGEITDFTGISAPYETPEAPDLRIDTALTDADAALRLLIDHLARRDVLDAPPANGPEAPAGGFSFRDLRIVPVFGALSRQRAAELSDFWLSRGAIRDPAEARRRTVEAVFLVLADDRIVGVNTVYRGQLGALGEYWFYRRFMDPAHRLAGVGPRLFRATIDLLAGRRDAEGNPRGIAVVAENRKLARPGARRMLARLGLQACGQTPQGQDVWRLDF